MYSFYSYIFTICRLLTACCNILFHTGQESSTWLWVWCALHISSNHSTLSKDDKINIIHLSGYDMLKSPIFSAQAVGLRALALNGAGLVPHSWFFVSDLTCLKCLARQHSIYKRSTEELWHHRQAWWLLCLSWWCQQHKRRCVAPRVWFCFSLKK